MIKHLFITLVLALSAAGTLPAQPGPPPAGMLKNLDLTEAQKQSIKTLFDKHQATRQARQQVLGTAEKALLEAVAEPATAEAQLRELHASASEARFAALLEDRAILQELQAVLTPAQQAKAKELRLKRQLAMQELQAGTDEPGGRPGPGLPW